VTDEFGEVRRFFRLRLSSTPYLCVPADTIPVTPRTEPPPWTRRARRETRRAQFRRP
jgi:hypothetical protein